MNYAVLLKANRVRASSGSRNKYWDGCPMRSDKLRNGPGEYPSYYKHGYHPEGRTKLPHGSRHVCAPQLVLWTVRCVPRQQPRLPPISCLASSSWLHGIVGRHATRSGYTREKVTAEECLGSYASRVAPCTYRGHAATSSEILTRRSRGLKFFQW